ncbi:uncharacterized protein exd3 [Oncorhynchus tshawytscha]|uniref:uncharacterized protein exd3 n=1 Tax=Oncorhynchus tshawytscha TaxID=74940 RepID=UPI001C3D24C8|nr:uncharacterized protein exd3 [Oncorhynchus tshawytscha]
MEQLCNWERRQQTLTLLRRYTRRHTHTHQLGETTAPVQPAPLRSCRCLWDVYSALSQYPACFGLPQDLRSISSLQMEKSKEKEKEEKKQASLRGGVRRTQWPHPHPKVQRQA